MNEFGGIELPADMLPVLSDLMFDDDITLDLLSYTHRRIEKVVKH